MLEYGIKTITTNPTLITKADEIIKLVDTRTNTTRAYVLPCSYAPLVEKLAKEIEYKKWAKEKKNRIKNAKKTSNDEELMEMGWDSVGRYLEEI